ncbi:hypothetical protein [Kitasatospora sp. GP82]|uniref:hypothetical protein n=1 Tax=Kitasatospora sp. GP82 TaxID=3035089 RepID=UPI0024743F8C|nr:hypothetical protein [Kitasatospora sp. GP82]
MKMTFARWLQAHHARRDARANPGTYLAQRVFQPCTRTTARTPADVSWATAEELHLVLCGEVHDCDWLCGYVEQAAVRFGRYAEAVKR